MGRLAKNPLLAETIAQSQVVPFGPSGTEPAIARAGSLRFDITTSKLRLHNGSFWQDIGTSGVAPVSYNSFTGDGILSVFGAVVDTLASPIILDPGQEPAVLVFIDSIYQTPFTAYNFTGTSNITFTSPPEEFAEITVLAGFTSVA